VAGADMISASTFVRQNSVWTQVAPYMEPVIHAANTTQLSLGTAVPSLSDNQRKALIAETAFFVTDSNFNGESYSTNELSHKAKQFFSELPHSLPSETDLSSDEWQEVGLLARVTQRYTSTLSGPIFSSSIPGCGVVDTAIADVMAGTELIEIKTVTRPFRTYDLRQALTYVAMLYSSGCIVQYITLLNPRRARVVKMSVGEIAAGIRGDSAVELLQDLIHSMMEFQVSA
jgi:hypothetical protein